MKAETRQFLDLLFDPGEEVSISHNEYGYHSIQQSDINGGIHLRSPGDEKYDEFITEDDINLIAMNPVKGFRRDANVTAFRTFLVEVDDMSLAAQKKYIEESGIPWSVCVFSGNKSLHYGIVLSEPVPTIELWRFVNNWILNILDKADQQVKNPSRSIRFPGNKRNNGKKQLQKLVELKGRVKQADLNIWLNKHTDKRPMPEVRERKFDINNIPDINNMPDFFYETLQRLQDGTQDQRNSSWFSLACMMADRNFELEEILAYLEQYFVEESDFTKREWEVCVRSAYKRSGI
jgi:hypothetical protein